MKIAASSHFRPQLPVGERQRRGREAEQQALELLQDSGLKLLARNVRFRVGELDLIMRDQEIIVFVEVRFRSPSRYGDAASSITAIKQQRLIRAASCWMRQQFRSAQPASRFDVVALDGEQVRWIKGAFGVSGPL
ncbi:MAG: YraN family protein [Betaproteobacteria bacterium]|nr:YraN family protein [Betaproteobacteria bacterium]